MGNKTPLWVGAGAVVAALVWLALAPRNHDAGRFESRESDFPEPDATKGSSGSVVATERLNTESRVESVSETAAEAALPSEIEEPLVGPVETVGTARPPNSAFADNPIVVNAPPRDLPVTPTELPNRRDDDPLAAAPAADILNSLRISCDFAAGNNTGLRYGDVLTVGGGAQWRGGLIVYDNIDAFAGTARMTGSVGATGSQIGEAKVRFSTEGSRIYLTGLLENRTYVVVAIFDELDNVGRHIAVLHIEASQSHCQVKRHWVVGNFGIAR